MTASAAALRRARPNTPTGQRIAVIVSNGVADAAKPAVAFAGFVVTVGALISLLVPNIPAEPVVPAGPWPDEAGAADPERDTDPDSALEPFSA